MRVTQGNPWLDQQCRTYQAASVERRAQLRAEAVAAMLLAHPFVTTLLSSGGRAERDVAWDTLRAACEQSAGMQDKRFAAAVRNRASTANPTDAASATRSANVTLLHAPAGSAD